MLILFVMTSLLLVMFLVAVHYSILNVFVKPKHHEVMVIKTLLWVMPFWFLMTMLAGIELSFRGMF